MSVDSSFYDAKLRAMQQQGLGALGGQAVGGYLCRGLIRPEPQSIKPEEKKEKTIREELQEETDKWLDQEPKYTVRF